MAQRDHSLDDKIIVAARKEFLEKSYSGASLRKIAEKAGITIGAIQTRYKNKDDLFVSLLKSFLDDIDSLFQRTKVNYCTDEDLLTSLKNSMQHESAEIFHLIFDYYEEAILLLCRSTGSSLEHYFDGLIQSKIEESICFFRNEGVCIDEKMLGLLISVQFDSYRRIVSDCSDRNTAEIYLSSLMTYHFGGWTAFLNSVNKLKEDM